MTQGQTIAFVIIGTIAVMAYIQAHEVAKAMTASGIIKRPQTVTA